MTTWTALLLLAATSQDVDPARVDKALQDASAFLLKKYERGFDAQAWNSPLELVMLSLSHAGVKPDEPTFQAGLKALETAPLRYTYRVSVLAMALQRIDAAKYRDRIAHCAQWLIDTQFADGDWGYPELLDDPVDVPPSTYDVPAPPAEKKAAKPGASATSVMLRRRMTLKPTLKGDISNTQFALLGLKAAADAGIGIPKTTWESSLKYFLRIQNRDGGWGYHYGPNKDPESYGSMTSAGVCSVAICRYALGLKDPQKDPAVRAGLAWLGRHFSPDANPNAEKSRLIDPARWHYYYLYSVERVGRLLELDQLGVRPWYAPGAAYLLEKQRPGGGWFTGLDGLWRQAGDLETSDTCFGILFLTKATPPLVPSVDARKKSD
ncbi:MAG TPA: prenyltransferase/squalene oxidase repeat-containing protein [Planctomycetota bacterium]|nr:prenyltransferase/squalene oxidase repeat-containing protein [Planctomycetota bacterium]